MAFSGCTEIFAKGLKKLRKQIENSFPQEEMLMEIDNVDGI